MSVNIESYMSDLVSTQRSRFESLHSACPVKASSVCIACAWILASVPVAHARRSDISPQVSAGKKLFVQACASCHEVNSRKQLVGPGLKGYYMEHNPAPNDSSVREIITRGKGTMPGFSSLSDAELADLIAYLKTL